MPGLSAANGRVPKNRTEVMKQNVRLRKFVLLAAILCSVAQAQAQLDRGHQTLVDRGLQLEALIFASETGNFDLSRWVESNFIGQIPSYNLISMNIGRLLRVGFFRCCCCFGLLPKT